MCHIFCFKLKIVYVSQWFWTYSNAWTLHLQCKKGAESKVESYIEVNAWTDWWQQDLIPEYDQILAYWTHKYYTGHIIANNKVRTISSEDQCSFTT